MLKILRQPGVRECDIDSVLEGAIANYQLEEELKNFKYGIAGLSDLYRATVERHNDLKIIMNDNELIGGSLRNAFSGHGTLISSWTSPRQPKSKSLGREI